jgi:DNA-directed RNA polymerase subunit L
MINLTNISKETFNNLLLNLLGTDNTLTFSNYTEEHEGIALNLGLTIYTSDLLEVSNESDDINSWC